jgi:hypothetical protein
MTKAADTDGAADGLEVLFAAARAAEPRPSEALVSRILADAATVGAGHAARAAAAAAPAVPPRGLGARLARLFEPVGGWQAAAGLGACAAAGFWLGLAGPESLLALPGLDGMVPEADPIAFQVIDSGELFAGSSAVPET